MPYNKYGNKKMEVDGYVFDSFMEANRYHQLKLLQRVGEISELKVHPKYELQNKFSYQGKSYRAIFYEADFEYKTATGHWIIEDVKGHATQEYLLKKKLLLMKLISGIRRDGQIVKPKFNEVRDV